MGEDTILVTGGGGFLGSAIVRRLISRGDNVQSFSRTEHPVLKELGIKQFCGDLTNIEALSKAALGCSVIYHVAAKAGIWGSYEDYFAPNVQGSKNVLTVCGEHNIKKLVYTSSPSVVFSGCDQECVNESEPYPDKYLSHYSATKAIAERTILHANSNKLSTVALRPHLIWGPDDNHIAPRLIARAKKGELRKVGRQKNLVDTIYIDNAVHAHILAADHLSPGSSIAGKAYFISQGEPIPMNEMIDRILKAGGLSPVNKYIDPRLAYAAGWLLEIIYKIMRRKDEPIMTRFLACQLSTSHWFDISAAKRDFDYSPKVNIEEGLQRLAESLNS